MLLLSVVICSFKEDTVREQMKSTEPRKPPTMVSHSVEPSCLLNICMPANTSTDSRLDRTRDVPVFTAAEHTVKADVFMIELRHCVPRGELHTHIDCVDRTRNTVNAFDEWFLSVRGVHLHHPIVRPRQCPHIQVSPHTAQPDKIRYPTRTLHE